MANYSEATADLIQRLCDTVERRDFELEKDRAVGLLRQAYDIYGFEQPKNVLWYPDVLGNYESSAFSASRASSASSAFSAFRASRASSASSASRAFSAFSAFSASSASSAFSASSASSASRAFRAFSAFSASSASRASTDYYFDWFVYSFEYCLNPDAEYPPNEEDRKYLAFSELLMLAAELGLGYAFDFEDNLHLAPTPLVLLDEENRYHADFAPAIRWKEGHEFYFLRGENFDKPLWEKIVNQNITAEEVMQIGDIDKRTIAISMLPPGEMLKQLKAELIHTGIKGNRLYRCKNFMGTGKTEYALVMTDASTPREFIKFTPPEIGKQGNADVATAAGYQDAEGNSLPLEDYLAIEQEA